MSNNGALKFVVRLLTAGHNDYQNVSFNATTYANKLGKRLMSFDEASELLLQIQQKYIHDRPIIEPDHS
jgi:hypothetical protein